MAQAQAAQIEYTIYTFDMAAAKAKASNSNSWKKHATLEDMAKAMAEAENLHQTQKFQKIEVKKKFFDQKTNRTVEVTLKVYETKPPKDFTVLIAVVCAVAGGGLAFAASYFLTQ